MLRTEKIFSDGMVLQRHTAIRVWGFYENTEQIWVKLGEEITEAALENGRFEAMLSAREAAEGLTFTITGADAQQREETLCFTDVAVGEVWIAGGQSNMEFQLRYDAQASELLDAPPDPLLRYFDVPKISYEGQEKDKSYDAVNCWRRFGDKEDGFFSAAGLFFGRKLREQLQVPVAVIGCNWGATSASCWLKRSYLEEFPELHPYLDNYEKAMEKLDPVWYREAFLERQQWGLSPEMQKLDEAMGKGTVGEISPQRLQEFLERLTPRQKELMMMPQGPMDQTRPCYLFDSMVMRIAGYCAKGVIWYQGEADEVLPGRYALLFSQMARCWRDHWQAELPFLCVQLAPFDQWLTNTGKCFPELRRQQQRAADVMEQVYLASIMDAGMPADIHPKQKKPVGERLALLALGKVYGKNILCEAPRFVDAAWRADGVDLYFAHAGEGLFCRSAFPEGLELFEDGKRVSCEAEISGSRIGLRCGSLKADSQVQVSYAWQPYLQADLYNSAGLCAKPFVTARPFDWEEGSFQA